ncbi:MAG TPA: TrkH family potassium uptake protein [Spirochaeta sp.]|nr:TrkH family potassium uptake protein [Spirochaeta sp.]
MKKNLLIITTFFLSILSLLFNSGNTGDPSYFTMRVIDILILLIITAELIKGYRTAKYRQQFILRNITLIIFSGVYLLALSSLFIIDFTKGHLPYLNLSVIVIRSLYLLYRGFENIKSLEQALSRLNDRPAISIISSFFAMIMLGTLLLMLPFSTADRTGLPFIDAWFTATSAVCVTGLIVVDTAAAFSIAGKVIILMLIQIGGLGIMIITYFSMFILGRKATIEEKQRLSFVISDTDISGIISTLKKIIYLTFSIEAVGAVLLFIGLGGSLGFSGRTAFSAVFHSISAFCNAGFSLFSNSLEGFASNPFVIFTVSLLIILGGLSFAVIFNVRDFINPFSRVKKINLNTRVVLIWTAVLLVSGFFIFYAAEHGGNLKDYSTGTQYLAAFFQSVTLRTAGFNSIPFSHFRTGTILIFCLYMFIGAASGSTAGGIKINTMAVMFAYLKSMLTNSPHVTLYRHQLSRTRVLRAFVVFQYGIAAVFIGSTALALSHDASLRDIIFEAVSAFGTVGLSTGMTSVLNSFGKVVIIFLMFNGRLGPLTILSIFSGKTDKSGVRYPQGDILIG